MVKGVEGIGLQNEGAGDVQYVKGAGTQKRSVPSSNLLRLLIGSGGKQDDLHDTVIEVFPEQIIDFFRLGGPQLFSEEPQSNGVEDFDFPHVGKEQRQSRTFHLGSGRGGIRIENIKGEQKAGVGPGGLGPRSGRPGGFGPGSVGPASVAPRGLGPRAAVPGSVGARGLGPARGIRRSPEALGRVELAIKQALELP